MRDRLLGSLALAAGLIVIALVQAASPAPSPPLYDGIVPVEPYKWVSPPPGEAGGAEGASATIPVEGGSSPLVALATPESVPQAQVFAAPGTLTLPPGAQALKVSITPIPTEGAPGDGHISGNVYRVSITDQAGAPATAPAVGRVSVVLRAPDPTQTEANVERFAGGAWQPLATSSAGFGATFIAVVTEFGDFALVAPGPGPSASASAVESGGTRPSSTSPTAVAASSGGQSSGWSLGLVVVAGLVPVLIVAAVVIVVLNRRRRAEAQQRNRRRRR